MHKAFPLLGESSHWQYKFPLPVEGVPTARRMEIPLPGVRTAMMKKLLRSDKVKEGVGYNAVPPPAADLYRSPKKDLSWTGLPEFVDDTVSNHAYKSPSHRSYGAPMRPSHGPASHRPHGPPMRPMRSNMNDARLRTLAVRPQYRAPWVPTVNRNFRKVPTYNSNVSTVCCCCSRHVNTARPKAVINRRNRVKDVQASASWVWKSVKPNSASIILKRYDYVDVRGRSSFPTSNDVFLLPEEVPTARRKVPLPEEVPTEFDDDTVTDYSRSSPTVESTSAEGPEFVLHKKPCFNCGDFSHFAIDCRRRIQRETTRSQNHAYKSPSHRPNGNFMRPLFRPAGHRPHGSSINPRRPIMNGARPYKTFFQTSPFETRPFLKSSAINNSYKAPWVPTVN
nr:hypothetical protein [Tanacetum cinerariifolium]